MRLRSARATEALASARRGKLHTSDDHRKLCRIDANALRAISRGYNLERSLLESLVPDHEPVAMPLQRLDAVAALVDEQEETAVGRVTCPH